MRACHAAIEDAQLHYQEHGVGDALLLVHGFTGAGEMWSNVVPGFADRYRLIVPDLRGHGRSTGAPETIRAQLFGADLVTLLDYLDVERAHFVGHSFGASALLFVGTRHLNRVRTMTLIGGTYAWDAHYRAYLRQRMGRMGGRS
jgi:pimeloyl-ACP methyl ester carboxylesterase